MRLSRSTLCLGVSVLITSCVALAVPAAAAANWPNWRGPGGQGHADDARVPLTWGESEHLLWRTPLPGRGNSSPVVWGDRVFLTAAGAGGRERYVLCVRAGDGKVLWQRLAARTPDPGQAHAWNGHASASCTTDGKHVYAFFGTPGLFCYDLAGRLVWKHTFGIFTSERGWGTAASPLVYEGLVIQNCDNDGPLALPRGHRPDEAAPMALVALDKLTGKVRWSARRDQGRGFGTPVVVTTARGRTDLVLNGPHGVWAYDPQSGKEIWHSDRHGEGDQESNTGRFGEPMPVHNADTLFAQSGRPGPFQAILLGATGAVPASALRWQVVRRGHRDIASPIIWGDALYAADNKGMLTCYDLRNGKVVYEVRLPGKAVASPVAVRGHLLFILDNGITIVLQPGRRFHEVGRNKLGEGDPLDFLASPAVAGGRLFLRSRSVLYCVGQKE